MTPRQRIALAKIAAHDHIDIPFLRLEGQYGQDVTKAEAYILIEMILDDVRPTTEYLGSLGRDADSYTTPPHPQFWQNRDSPPTVMQRAWLHKLIDAMSVPETVKNATREILTRGQASLLIGRLRELKGHIRPAEEKRMVLEEAVRAVRTELPAPGHG